MFAARGYGRKNEWKGRDTARDREMERRKQRERGEVEIGERDRGSIGMHFL